MRKLRELPSTLSRTFFAPASGIDLAVLRFMVYGYVFVRWWGRTHSWDVQAAKPVGLFHWVPLASGPVLQAMQQVGQYAAVLCFFGIAFRPAAIVCALTLPYLAGVGNNFGKVNHIDNLLVLTFVILALSRAGDHLSLSAWWRKRSGQPALEPSGEYRWPIAAVWLIIAGMYWSAGVSKLIHTGWDWALSENFRLLLIRHHVTHNPPTELGLWLAQYPTVCHGLAVGALVAELLCPLLLLGGYWTLLFGGAVVGLQFGIYVTLGVAFKSMVPVFAALVPWHALYLLLTARFAKSAT